jgi:hypothetical protein
LVQEQEVVVDTLMICCGWILSFESTAEANGAAAGFVVPIPTLLPDWVMTELPSVGLSVNTGTVPEVPEPVTCAEMFTAHAPRQNATPMISLCTVLISFPG